MGDNVYIAPGSKLIGGITLGNGTAVGANAVVTKDTPENAVVVGIPAEVISLKGSGEYVIRTVENIEIAIPNNKSCEHTQESNMEKVLTHHH